MASVPSKVVQQDLGVLARKITEAHEAAEETAADAKGAAQHALGYADKAGELLTEAKGKVGHGGWGDWLAENVPFSERTARNYMKLHKSFASLIPNRQRAADLSMREAMRLLQHMEDEEPNEKPVPAGRMTETSSEPGNNGASGNGSATPDAEAVKSEPSPTAAEPPKAVADPAPPPAPIYDAANVAVPARLRPVFEAAPQFDKALEHFRQITALANQIGDGPASAHFKVGVAFERDLRNARDVVKFARPYAVCPHCKGKGSGNGCSAGTGCKGLGWMTQDQYANVPAELKGPKA